MQVKIFLQITMNSKDLTIRERNGLTALDACCACGGGTHLCNITENLEISFYGRCNCTFGFIWSNEQQKCIEKPANCIESRGSVCGSC